MDASEKAARASRSWQVRFWILLGLGLALAHVLYAVWRAREGHADLVCFHRTSLHWLKTGEFTREFGVRHYVPAFVVLITPLVAWPLRITAALLAFINVLLLMVSVRTAGGFIAARFQAAPPAFVRWVWPLVLVLPFASGTVALGQVNILVLWLCLAALRQVSANQNTKAGLAIGVAGVIKLYPLLLIVPLLLKGRHKAAAAAGAAFVLLAGGLSLAGFGWRGSIDAHRQWLEEVRGGDTSGSHLVFHDAPNEFLRLNNQSLAAVLRRLTTTTDTGRERMESPIGLSVGQAKALYAVMTASLLFALAWTSWRGRDAGLSLGEWSAWLAAVIALVPIYWTHYFVLLLPALSLLGASVWHSRSHHLRAPFATGLQAAWLVGLLLLGVGPARWVGVHCWLGLAVALWAAMRREPPAEAGPRLDDRQ